MKYVLTMTMNPCIDRTVTMSKFQMGATNYATQVLEEAAGKGINVAVGLAHIQVPVKALGFAYKEDVGCLYEKLDAEGIGHAFVELPGKMRVNQKLFDQSTREMTEVNERGQAVSKEAVETLLALLESQLEEAEVLVLSGSVPPGVDSDIYARMIRMAKKAGVITVLDASGELLKEAVKETPYLIKPNKEEFMQAFMDKEDTAFSDKGRGCGLDQNEREQAFLLKIAQELADLGIAYVCVSMGKEGMVLADSKGAQTYPAKECEVKSLQGAGDAMVAGFCKAIYEKEEKKMAEYALHMAASTIGLEGTRMGTL